MKFTSAGFEVGLDLLRTLVLYHVCRVKKIRFHTFAKYELIEVVTISRLAAIEVCSLLTTSTPPTNLTSHAFTSANSARASASLPPKYSTAVTQGWLWWEVTTQEMQTMRDGACESCVQTRSSSFPCTLHNTCLRID